MLKRFTFLVGRAFRETGQSLQSFGKNISGEKPFDQLCRHRRIMSLYESIPKVPNDSFVAPNASVIGDVTLSIGSSVWYGAVIRGDMGPVTVGCDSNVQDRTVISIDSDDPDPDFPTSVTIGSSVTIGHGCLLTSCRVDNNCLIGMGSILERGVHVKSNSIIAAGSVVLQDTIIDSGQLWAGNPAHFVRELSSDEKDQIEEMADRYSTLAGLHREEFPERGTDFKNADGVEMP